MRILLHTRNANMVQLIIIVIMIVSIARQSWSEPQCQCVFYTLLIPYPFLKTFISSCKIISIAKYPSQKEIFVSKRPLQNDDRIKVKFSTKKAKSENVKVKYWLDRVKSEQPSKFTPYKTWFGERISETVIFEIWGTYGRALAAQTVIFCNFCMGDSHSPNQVL